MGKGKYKNKNQPDEDEDFGKKKKNVITQQLLMDKSNMDFTQFIPLLPSDVLYPPFNISPASTQALLKIVTDLNYLLYLDPKNFWATVTYNISFQHCLSSCFSQLSARWMNKYIYPTQDENEQDCDFNYRMVKDSDAYSYIEALQEVLLKIVYRIMQFQEQDPKLNEIYNFGQNTIKKLNVFNFIKLMQLIEIYQSREENYHILKTISRNFVRILHNPYKYFVDDLLPHILKKLQQNNRDFKMVSDREEFGINYSYNRANPKNLSPGEEELKRKVTLLMNCISTLEFLRNTKFVSEQIYDHIHFNSQVNFLLENTFYELDAAYKIWNFQGMEKRLLPMINYIFEEVIQYFVEYFNKANQRVVKRTSKNNVDAYVRSLERFFVDYGKRYSLGKKGAAVRHMTMFKLLMKKVNLLQMFQELYEDEEQNKTYDINLEYFIDFKLALEDSYKQDNYIHGNDARQNEVEEQTQVSDDVKINDIDEGKNPLQSNVNNQQVEEQQEEDAQKIKYFSPQNDQKLQFLVSKKSRQDDYYEQLYMKQRQRFKIEYDDEYDDLADYGKRPLFMDSASSDSDSQDEVRLQRLVSNENNQKVNQLKHTKFQQKLKQKKNQPKYSKVSKQQKEQISQKQDTRGQQRPQRDQGKVRYAPRNNRDQREQQKPKFTAKYTEKEKQPQKQKGNNLQSLLDQQRMPRQGQQMEEQEQQNGNKRGGNQGGRGGQGGQKRRFVPNATSDNKNFNDKGRNSNKNREHGNPTNQAFGGGKKYKAKY